MPDSSVKKLDVSGTLDLLGYDQDGKFYVFDMKTVRSDNYINDKEKNDKWNRQLQLYKQFLQDKYNIEVAGTYIIPIKVNYDTPLGAKHKDGTDMDGTAEYSVKNPELKTQYDNPNRSQILQDGVEFKDAAPELRPILNKNPHEGNIKYEYLDDAAKAILDGTVTVENYKQQQITEEIEKPIDVTEEVKEDTSTEDEFAQFEDDGSFDDFDSSVTEITSKQENDYTSEMQSIKERAIIDGTFMKAPNGNPTNLNERQWLQVRTTAFKNWFGDWEIFNKINPYNTNIKLGNPEADINSVDADGFGTIIPVYNNGSYIGEIALNNTYNNGDYVINGNYVSMPEIGNPVELEEEHRGKGYGKAMYFELAKQIANKGKILRSATDSSRTPASTRVWESLVRDGYAKRINDRYEIINSSLSEASKVVDKNGEPLVVYHESPNIFNVFDVSKKRYNVHEVNGIWASPINRNGKGYGKNIYPLFINLREPIRTSVEQVTNIIELRTLENKALKDNNSDGVILNTIDKFGYETQYYVKNPNQVKSATDNTGEFSTINDDIRYSSVTELPSIPAFAERLPVAQQAKFGSLVASAEISTYCR